MCGEKCGEIAVKLATIHDLLNEVYMQGLPDHLEAEHGILVRELDRLQAEWKAQGCDRYARELSQRSSTRFRR
jgi:hypothetical protein